MTTVEVSTWRKLTLFLKILMCPIDIRKMVPLLDICRCTFLGTCGTIVKDKGVGYVPSRKKKGVQDMYV